MKPFLFLFFLNILIVCYGQSTSKSDLVIGETIELQSQILDETRVLNIYLPQGYHPDSLMKYPVIYLLDGSINEDFIHVAGLTQFASFPWINMLEPSIVVGIANIDRKKDFTYPTNNEQDLKDFPTTGHSQKFIDFIEKELQPFIDKNYSCSTEKTIIGQSLGGLLATEILFKRPELFNNYIIVSPSLWWDDESLLTYKPEENTTIKNIYIAVGAEGEVMERVAKELFDKLKAIQSDNTSVYFEYFKEQNHGDVLHLALYKAFELLDKNQ